MAIKQLLPPKNLNSLGILGYLIIVNNQVHSYQTKALDDYLAQVQLDLSATPLEKILAGNEDSISFASSLSAYENEQCPVRRDLFYLLIVLASLDNVIDESELNLINQIQISAAINNEEADVIKNEALNDAKSIRISQNKLFEKPDLVTRNNPSKHRNPAEIIRSLFFLISKTKKRTNKNLMKEDDSEYLTSIEKCSHIAQEDYGIVLPSLSNVIATGQACIDELKTYKNSISLETGLSAEVAKVVSCFIDSLNENVLAQCTSAKLSMQQKERTVPDFTVSLLGRTKAGKSTLHSILTNQGKSAIGQGMQRTTRFNRVYQWNLLRIIDTPGIGSAEEEGRRDEQIAESILGESDIICFVVANDSILQDILDEIKKISALNKPIVILLNYKENIKTPAKFRRFLADPKKWLTDTGANNLSGYTNRIMRYATEHNFGGLIKVYPVFLLATQMASAEEYAAYSRVLWDSSNIDSFISQIKKWISSAGSMKRSQTILDETIQVFKHSLQELDNSRVPIQKQIIKLTEQRSTKNASLYDAEMDVIKKIRSGLQDAFDDLALNRAMEFAELCYEKHQQPQKLWQDYISEIGFENEVNSLIESETKPFMTLVNETVIELFEDLHYTQQMDRKMSDIAAAAVDIDFRMIARIAGRVIGLAGTVLLLFSVASPIGWILAAVGTLAGLGAVWIESNPSKRKKSIDKIYLDIKNNILEQAPQEIEKTISIIKKDMNDKITIIDNLYSDLLKGLDKVLHVSDKLETVYLSENDRLNKAYAWRIIQYLQHIEEEYSEEIISSTVRRVERTDDGKFIIDCGKTDLDTKPLEGVIADRIILAGG